MKKHFTLSNMIYGISMLFALSVLIKTYIDRSRLPEGVCPAATNSEWMYAAIGFLVVATVVTSFLDHKKKGVKTMPEEEGHRHGDFS